MSITLPNPLEEYEGQLLVPEGEYFLHLSSAYGDVINDKPVMKTLMMIDGIPNTEDQSHKSVVGKEFEMTYYITHQALPFLRQLCDAIGVSSSFLQKTTLNPEELLNRPFAATVKHEVWGGFTRAKIQPGTYRKSVHELAKKNEPKPENDEKDDLPF